MTITQHGFIHNTHILWKTVATWLQIFKSEHNVTKREIYVVYQDLTY